MQRRTFLGTCAALLGMPWLAPAHPRRSKPYIEEGRPEYEEPPADYEGTLIPMRPGERQLSAD